MYYANARSTKIVHDFFRYFGVCDCSI